MAKTTIPAGYFAAGSIATADIADDAVTADKLAANSVVSASIVNGSIVTADLADDAITAAKIDSTATGMTFAGVTSNKDSINLQMQSSTGTSQIYQKFINDGGNSFIGLASSTGAGLLSNAGAYSLNIQTESARNLAFGTNNTLRMLIDGTSGNVGIGLSSPTSSLSVGPTTAHSNNRITIFSDDYNYGQIRVGSSTSEASLGFLRSTTQANTDANSPSGGNDTWAIGLGVWGANFGIGSNSILDNCVEWDSSGHMLPGTNNTYDLGSATKGWRNIYTNDLNLSNMAPAGTDSEGNAYTRPGNDVDGTNGSWTIQEGADDLFIINRINGKKYRFNLTEVTD